MVNNARSVIIINERELFSLGSRFPQPWDKRQRVRGQCGPQDLTCDCVKTNTVKPVLRSHLWYKEKVDLLLRSSCSNETGQRSTRANKV